MERAKREWYQTEQCSEERSRHFRSNHKLFFDIIHESEEVINEWSRDFHEIVTGKPPTSSEEWERRSKLLNEDRIYLELRKKHDEAIDKDRLEKGWYMHQRRWQFYIARNPEELVNISESYIPHPPPKPLTEFQL